MSYPRQSGNNCTIYSSFLCSDIQDYTVNESGSLNLTYSDGSTSACSINTTAIKTIIDAHKPSGSINDIWLPAIVSNSTYIQNKELLFGNVIGTKLLGIEEILKFSNIKLKNWNISTGNIDLCIDWIINSNKAAYEPEYGVLCWYKLNSVHKSDSKYKLSQIPPGTRIKCVSDLTYSINDVSQTISTSTPLLKINNDFIKRLDKDSSRYDIATSGYIHNHTDELDTIPLSLIGISDSVLFTVEDNTNNLSDDLKDYDLWISNGDFYSYFFGGKDKYRRWQHTDNQRRPTRSYLSSGLYHIYRTIYNQITSKFVKDFGKSNNKTYVLEKLKKLCYILATSPLIDRVNINTILDNNLYNKIISYINASVKTTTNEEIKELLDILFEIFTTYKNQSQFLQKQTLATNYINNKKDLFISLSNKYISYGKISSNTTINFRYNIEAGSHGYINMGLQSFVPISASTADTDIYNDMKIQLGSLYVETQMNPNLSSSGCICKIGDSSPPNGVERYIPLANMAFRQPEKLLTSFNKDYAVKLRPGPSDSDPEPRVDIAQSGDYAINVIGRPPDFNDTNPRSYSYFFTLVDGPDCFRFTSPGTNPFSRNKTSTSNAPGLYLNQTGLYTIRGTTTLGSALKCIEDIDVYVYDQTPPLNLINYNHTETVPSHSVMCPNIRQLAFNKNGLVWFIDSDIYVADASFDFQNIKPSRLIDKKVNIQRLNTNSLTSPAQLSISFLPNNTVFKLNSIEIKNVIDNNDKYAQCMSFYTPGRAMVRGVQSAVGAIGGSRFALMNKPPGGVSFLHYYKDSNNNNEWTLNNKNYIDFNYPEVSTVYSPNVYTYGGYSQSVVNQLGVEIPYHPIKTNNGIESFKKIPSNTIWNTTGSVIESGLLASAPAKLPIMSGHNNLGNTNIRCFTTKIPVTGYSTFTKGYFHPNSGWYDYNSSYTGRTNFIKKFQPETYKSYKLVGQGFFDIRPNNNHISGINIPMEYSNGIKIMHIDAVKNEIGDLGDQDPIYGIRNWNGYSYGSQELIDDIVLVEDLYISSTSQFLCDYAPYRTYAIIDKNFNNLNLTIQDLEIQINYINIANPKNIIFALEVYNPNLDSILSTTSTDFLPFGNTDRTSDPMSWGSSDNKLLSFIKAYKDTNTLQNKPNTRIVYLYNQESLDNYGYNFSLTFSENFDKNHSFTDNNKNSSGVIGVHNHPITNNSTISPCVSPTGYSEIDSYKFRHMMKNNRINLLAGSLSQFKNLPLVDTRFDLKVYVLGPEENIIQADNVLLNSYLSGLSEFYATESSNTISNSICNWSLIIHTNKTPKFVTSDYLGSIDYDADASTIISGYNFIADMSGKEYLIPKVNLNAPYTYINTNLCNYAGEPDLSKPLSYFSPTLNIPIMTFIPFFTIGGGLASISVLTQQISQGGRNDPIISFFTDVRYNAQSEIVERAVFTPVYDGAYTGTGGKSLIQLYNSGDKLWYTLEVPIFKYKNIAILSPNRFKYLKLHKDMAIPFSNFPFRRIAKIEELVNVNDISYSTTGNISLNGLTVENVTLKQNAIVNVQNQNTTSQNGIYYAKSSSWSAFPDFNDEQSLLRNTFWNNNTINISNINDKKIIAIPGTRVYNLFDINDNISIMKVPAASGSDLTSNTISNKAVLQLSDQDFTIFTLTNGLADGYESGFVGHSLSDSNVLMIYKDNTTYGNDLPASKWSFTKSYSSTNHINNTIKDSHSVAVGQGSVGYGSFDMIPSIYDILPKHHPNKILKTTDILNNNINDKFKYNNLTVKQYSDNVVKTISFPTGSSASDLLQAYPAGYDNTKYILNNLKEYSLISPSGYSLNGTNIVMTSGSSLTDNQIQELDNILKNNLSQNKSDFYFIDLKSNKFKTEITSISGEIFIENDFIKTVPYKPMLQSDISKIQDRLSILQSKSDPLPNVINLQTSSIHDLEIFYSLLPPDPSGCSIYSANGIPSYCSGQIARERLQALYNEKNQLLQALEINNHNGITGALPYFETIVSESGGSISIKYSGVSDSHYILNIDPEQECKLALETSPKILKSIQFDCMPIVADVIDSNCSTICNGLLLNSQTINGNDITIGSVSRRYINSRAEEEKLNHPGIVWDNFEYIVEKQFFMACKDSPKETLVKVREAYLVPRMNSLFGSVKVKDIFSLNSMNSINIQFKNVPRKIKTVDTFYTRFVPDFRGRLGRDRTPPEGGPISNDFMVWQCIKVPPQPLSPTDSYPNSQPGEFIDPPDFYKYMNEMAFRAFFGSADGVENKNLKTLLSQSLWEWIPYEYFQ